MLQYPWSLSLAICSYICYFILLPSPSLSPKSSHLISFCRSMSLSLEGCRIKCRPFFPSKTLLMTPECNWDCSSQSMIPHSRILRLHNSISSIQLVSHIHHHSSRPSSLYSWHLNSNSSPCSSWLCRPFLQMCTQCQQVSLVAMKGQNIWESFRLFIFSQHIGCFSGL